MKPESKVYLNSQKDIPDGCKISIYGTGQAGQNLYNLLCKKRKDVEIVCFADTFKTGTVFGKTIVSLDDLKSKKDEIDLILIASVHAQSIKIELVKRGIHNFLIVNPDLLVERTFISRILNFLEKFLVVAEWGMLPVLFVLSYFSRFSKRPIDIGLGPEPLINNVYHKKALEKKGYSAETFVTHVFYITDMFDFRGDLVYKRFVRLRRYFLFMRAIFRYRCLYIYFNGGPLGFTRYWQLEPFLYKLARIKTVVMPYGSDVQEMTRSSNLLQKNATCRDYPGHRLRRSELAAKIDVWTQKANHIISGCEWVDYMYHWDTLMLAHFSIDVNNWAPSSNMERSDKILRILHAPNHLTLKGTSHFINAVEELKSEGYGVELIILQKVPNEKLKELMASVDIVADQLIVGWYAMFAIEGMAMEKPVLCYIRDDLERLYIETGLLKKDELPIIKCSFDSVKEIIKSLIGEREKLKEMGKRSREFVIKHHSIDYVGEIFDGINKRIGIIKRR